MRDFLAATRERTIVYDGGMGATLEQFDLSLEDDYGLPGRCHEVLVLKRPDVIEGVHSAMLEAGAEVLETDSFQASRLKLDEWGLGEHTVEINRKAAEIARKAAGEDRFVAGSIGPTGFLPASDDPTLGQISFRQLVDVFTEQAQALVEGGVDLIIIETAQDILEVKAAVFGARRAFTELGRKVPIQCSVSLLPQAGTMLLGTDISAVLTTLDALDVDMIGASTVGVWGWTDRPGTLAHWPGGIVVSFPKSGSVNGTLVMAAGDINLTFKRYLTSPVRMTLKNDYITDLEGEGADPRIKQLHGLSTRLNLCIEIFNQSASDQRHHRMPRAAIVVHQGLCMNVIFR